MPRQESHLDLVMSIATGPGRPEAFPARLTVLGALAIEQPDHPL